MLSDSVTRDSVFEALFRQAVIDNFYEELDSLPPDVELAKQFAFSPEHELRMKKLFAREERLERLHTTAKWSRRLVATIAIVVTLLFGSLMLVPQVRATVVQTLIEWYERFTMFTSNAPEAEKTNLEPQYIPIGFVEIVRDELELMTTILYLNEDDGSVISFSSTRMSGSTAVDNEMVDYIVSVVNGNEYHCFVSTEAGGEVTIVWEKNNQRYIITSTISIDELMKMAVSVEN